MTVCLPVERIPQSFKVAFSCLSQCIQLSLLHLIWKIKKPKKKKKELLLKQSPAVGHCRLASGSMRLGPCDPCHMWCRKGTETSLIPQKVHFHHRCQTKAHEHSASQTIIQPVKCHVALYFSISR